MQRVSLSYTAAGLSRAGPPAELIEEVGQWCRESFMSDATQRKYYRSREAAEAVTQDDSYRLTIRRTSLEDVFIKIAGATFEESECKAPGPNNEKGDKA